MKAKERQLSTLKQNTDPAILPGREDLSETRDELATMFDVTVVKNMQPEEVGGLLFEIDISRLQNGYNFVKLKKHLGLLVTKYLFYLVAKGGIEPPTQGFSVY